MTETNTTNVTRGTREVALEYAIDFVARTNESSDVPNVLNIAKQFETYLTIPSASVAGTGR